MQRIIRSLILYHVLVLGAIGASALASGCSSVRVNRLLQDIGQGVKDIDKFVDVTQEQVTNFCESHPDSKLCAPKVQEQVVAKLAAGPMSAADIEVLVVEAEKED
jgi:hypothetical protein